MAITIRAVGAFADVLTGPSDTYPLPSDAATGDLLLISVGTRATGSLASTNWTPDTGYVEVAYVEDPLTGQTEPHGIVFRKFHTGSEVDPTVTSTAGINMMIGAMAALTGVDTTTPEDAAAVGSINPAAAEVEFTPTGITTVTAGAWVFSFVWGTGVTNFALKAGAEQGFTLLAGGGTYDSALGQDMGLGIAYKEIATAGPVTCPTWTCTTSEWIATTTAFRPAGGGTAHTATQTDPEGLLDAIAQVVAAVRSQTDPQGLTDSRTQVAASVRTVTDALGLLDTGSSVAEVIRDADLFWITDSATRLAAYQRPLTDPQGLTDSATYELTGGGTAHTATITDPLGLTDTAVQVSSHVRSQTDPLGLLDAASVVSAAVRAVTDPLGLVDSVTREAAHVQTVTDPLGLTDATTYEQSGAGEVLLTDLLGLVDSGDASLEAESDLVGLVDSVSYELSSGTTATFTDPLGLVDTVQATGAFLRVQTDPVGLTDSITVDLTAGGVAHTVTVTDGLGLTDTATTVASFTRVIVDPSGLSDTATTTAAFVQSFTDPLGLLDPMVVFHSAAIQPRWQESGPTTGEVDGSLNGGLVEGSPGRGSVEGDLVAVGQEGG